MQTPVLTLAEFKGIASVRDRTGGRVTLQHMNAGSPLPVKSYLFSHRYIAPRVERFPFFSQWRFQLAGLQIGREVVGAGATADRPVNQVTRPGCLGLHNRRRDALTAAPQQDTAPHPSI